MYIRVCRKKCNCVYKRMLQVKHPSINVAICNDLGQCNMCIVKQMCNHLTVAEIMSNQSGPYNAYR